MNLFLMKLFVRLRNNFNFVGVMFKRLVPRQGTAQLFPIHESSEFKFSG